MEKARLAAKAKADEEEKVRLAKVRKEKLASEKRAAEYERYISSYSYKV